MEKTELELIYRDYYNNLKYSEIIKNNNCIINILYSDIFLDSTAYIYITTDYNHYKLLFQQFIGTIFNHFPNIKIISPFIKDDKYIDYMIDKDTVFTMKNNNIYPINALVFDKEFVDYTIAFVKYHDKNGYFESMENYDLSHFSTVKTIGICYFDKFYYNNTLFSDKFSILVTPDGYFGE